MSIFQDITVELISSMGSDLQVVNAARVSFNKESSLVDGKLQDKDEGLIKYLNDHGHWTPFSHTAVTFRVTAPVFVARQLIRHTVGLTWNEVSRRYVDDGLTFYKPESWRKRVPNLKQGSSQTESVSEPVLDGMGFEEFTRSCMAYYEQMLAYGVAPELARIVLPHHLMTSWYWTGNIASFARVCRLRLDEHAQYESRLVAQQISKHMRELYPVSWKHLIGE